MLEAGRENLKARKQKGFEAENDRAKRGLGSRSLLHAEASIRHAFN